MILWIKHKNSRRDHPVSPLLLKTGHAAQRLVGDILPQPLFAYIGTMQLNALDSLP